VRVPRRLGVSGLLVLLLLGLLTGAFVLLHRHL